VFNEPLAHNPFIALYRRFTPKDRTHDFDRVDVD
jgi:hypothetical protein